MKRTHKNTGASLKRYSLDQKRVNVREHGKDGPVFTVCSHTFTLF